MSKEKEIIDTIIHTISIHKKEPCLTASYIYEF